jgi:hypothetical protein
MTEALESQRGKNRGEILSPFMGHPYKVTETGLIPGFRDEPRALLSFILRVLDGKHRQMVRHHLERFKSDDPELLPYAIDGMIAAMREMADMWIDSGKSRTDKDVDSPADRNVEDVLPGRDYSLFQRIDWTLLRSYPRYTEMTRDGSLQIKDTFPKFEVMEAPWTILDSLRAWGEKMAAFHFCRFLNFPDSRHISRCDHCKRYFAYQRARLRTVKHGVFCPACEGKASVKRTEISRAKRLDTAAKAWLEWNPRKRIEQRQWVADRVSDAHATTLGRRWVTQNLTKIQERVEALQNAKS